MAQPLAAFLGAVLYLDTTILVAFLDPDSIWHASCRRLFERAMDPFHPIRLVTATLTADELTFVLLQELVARPPFGVTRSRSQYLSTHPEVVRQLMARADPVIEDVLALLVLEPVLPDDITAMRREMVATGTLPRDAIHLAVLRRLEIGAIASDDDGFDGREDITLYKP